MIVSRILFFLCFQIMMMECQLNFNKPNFVFVLTDDLDIALGGVIPLKSARKLIAEKGAVFKNMFVTTPLCCPSRASILTGKYSSVHGVVNNSINGNCNSYSWQLKNEPKSFITYFKEAGYVNFYAGKYLNQYGKPAVGGVNHVPPGWDHWNALVGNSCYYNYSLSVNGTESKYGSDPQKDYLTSVIFRKAQDFLLSHNDSNPFFMFLSPPAPHAPFTPVPKYSQMFSNFSAPRTPNFNIKGDETKHWLLRQPPSPLPEEVVQRIDEIFRNRWRTLLSVDDGIKKLYKVLKIKQMLKNTYIIFSSDNGFHLGQFSLPWDKRQMYEFDIRVPLFIRGPGVKSGLKINHPVLNIDLAPTFLELASILSPPDMDGTSFASLLKSKTIPMERMFVIEHHGESSEELISGCPQYKPQEVHTCEIDCICEDSKNNTFSCIRDVSDSRNSITCVFEDGENFVEQYNLTADPFQLKNLYPSFEKKEKDIVLKKFVKQKYFLQHKHTKKYF